MTANLQGGKFNSMSINAADLNYFSFDFQGNLITKTKSYTCNSKGSIKIDAETASRFKTLSGDLTFHTNDGRVVVDANSAEDTAIYLNTSNEQGGIKLNAGSNGIKQLATGDISLISSGGDINIGLPDDDFENININNLTRNIQLEAVATVSVNAEDFQVVVSDSLTFLSLTNNIVFGDSLANPAIKISDGDVAIGTGVAGERKFAVAVSESSNDKPDYDGILLKSLSDDVGPEMRIKNNNAEGMLCLGIEGNTSIHAAHKEFMAFKKDDMIIKIGNDVFTNDDIGTQIYWTGEGITDTINSLSTYVSEASEISNADLVLTHTLTTEGTYTGITTKHFIIVIDNVTLTPNRFKWSSDGGVTFTSRFVVTGTSIDLEDGISITFAETTGYSLYDYWTFTATVCAICNTSNDFATQNVYSLKPNLCYLMTETPTQLKIGTANNGRINIAADGNIGINTVNPSSTLEITSKVGQIQLVNTTTSGNQLHPSVAGFINGGYVVVWENDTNIYGQQYYADSSKNGSQFQINVTSENNQSFPHVVANINQTYGGYMVVWATERTDTGRYDIRGQIYDETTRLALKTFDIEINQASSYNTKYPRVTSLSSGDYMVVWESDDNNTGNTNIYVQKITRMGNLSGSDIQVNTTTVYAAAYPYISFIDETDETLPGGFVVAYMNKTDADADIYDVLYRLYDSDSEPYAAPNNVTTGTTKSYGRPCVTGLRTGGFALSYFRSYESDVTKFTIGEAVSTGSGALYTTGVISDYLAPNKLHITSVSPYGVFQIGNEITGSSSNHIEQIKSVSTTSDIFTLDPGDIELTLSDNLLSLSYLTYSTSSNSPLATIATVNTTKLVDYPAQLDANPSEYTRDYTVFDYKKPIPSMSQLNDDNVILCWYNGLVPNIYYQKVDTLNNTLLGDEKRIIPSLRGLKQINPCVTEIVSVNHRDMGYVISWQNESVDFDMDGIFQVRFDDDNYLISAGNLDRVWFVDNDGNMGLDGTITVNGVSSDIILQNSNTVQNSYLANSSIVFKNASSTTLGEIKACYAKSYDTPYPKSDNLQLWYTFNETNSAITVDRSTNENTGLLTNFDIFRNKDDTRGIYFNGIDNYINCGNNISITSIAQSGFTISMWIKFPENISSGTYELINNNDGTNQGTYRLYISNSSIIGTIYTSAGAQQITSTTDINTDEYTFVCFVGNNDGNNEIYINGALDTTTSYTGSLAAYNSGTVMIGVRGNTNFFIGNVDDVRVYNTVLSSSEISEMYGNITMTKGQIILKTNNGTSLLSDTLSGVVIDDNGNINNLRVKGDPIDTLTGSVSVSGTTTVTGTNTLFLSEVIVGDQMNINGNIVTVTHVNSNTDITVDRALTASDSYPQRMPSIISVKNVDNGINLILTSEGNLGVGELNPTELLHVSSAIPYMCLENTTDENTNNGRLTGIKFKGLRGTTRHDLVKIEASHIGTGNNNYGQFNVFTNNGLGLVQSLSINHNGQMGAGDAFTINDNINYEFRSRLDIPCNFVISNGIQSTNGLQERASNLFFQNVEAAVSESNPELGSYAKIMGSADTNNTNIIGRLDLFTNNEDTLVSYLTIKGNGNTGIGGIDEPVNPVHMSNVEYMTGTASQSGTTVTGYLTDFSNVQVGSIIVFANNKSGVITVVGGVSTLTVSTSQNVAEQNYKIYYPGMSLSSDGNFMVGTTTSYPANFHIQGSMGLKVTNVTTNTTLSTLNNVVICTNGSPITISLPPAATSSGITYTIKKAGAGNVIIDAYLSETIDGSSNNTISTANDKRQIICDGSAWYVIG